MIVFGGFLSGTIGKYSSSLFSLDLEKLEWTEIAIMGKLRPPPRANTAMVVLDQTLMIFGGSDLSAKFKDLWRFNLEGNTWEQVATE
jgi:N-acetylneuraminic acid mutarotase